MRRAKPSSCWSSTSPTPSTCPWTTWPPRRSVARSGSSRFTEEPGARSPSDDRASVSFMASATNESLARSTAVRHTPLIAIESPAFNSGTSGVAIVIRAPSSERSIPATDPTPCTSPVNTARLPILDARRHEQVLSDAVALERQRACRIRDRVHALALERIARRPAAQHHRREEQTHLVDLAGVHERTGEMRAALEQDRTDPVGPELVERRAYPRRFVLPSGHDHISAVSRERVGGGARGGARDDHGERHFARAEHKLRVERQARERIEHDPSRLANHDVDPRGQPGIVGQRRPDTDRDGIALRPP